MSDQFRVNTERSLNLRKTAGGAAAPVVASVLPHVLVHVTGPANAAGFAPGYVAGWLGADGKTLYADSLGPDNSSIDAVIFDQAAFEAQDEPDVYGRQRGVARGWVYMAYLEAVDPEAA